MTTPDPKPETPLSAPSSGDRRPRLMRFLTGQGGTAPLPPEITAPGGGGKFDPLGRPLQWPGNTFICHIDRESAFYRALGAVLDGLVGSALADHYTFLPRPSLHMTIFSGVDGAPLGQSGWPDGIERTATRADVSARFLERVQHWDGPTRFDVVASHMALPATVAMAPARDADAALLQDARRRLQDITGIYRVDFATYAFHITLGYLTRWLTEEEATHAIATADTLFDTHLSAQGVQMLGPIEFCDFDTMHHFEQLGVLQR